MQPITLFIKTFARLHAVEDNRTFGSPSGNGHLLGEGNLFRSAIYQWSKDGPGILLKITHPSIIASCAYAIDNYGWTWGLPSINGSMFIKSRSVHSHIFTWPFLDEFQQPLRPDMFFGVNAAIAEDAKFVHGGLNRGEETENSTGYGYTHPEAGRLLQESEESRHAVSVPRPKK